MLLFLLKPIFTSIGGSNCQALLSIAIFDCPWLQTKANQNGVPFNLRDGDPSSIFTTSLAKKGGLKCAIMALYLSDSWQDNHGKVLSAKEIHNQYTRLIDDPRCVQYRKVGACKSLAETHSQDNGLFPIMTALEGGRLINDSLDTLSQMHNDYGLKYLTLTHNRHTTWADSSTDTPYHGGLNSFGKKVIKRCNELGLLVDVSHSSDATAHMALDYSERPIIATHSGVKALVKQPRNLDDDLIDRISDSGGIICVPFAKRFMGHYKVADHIDYIAQRVGVDKVGIGSDIDGAILVPSIINVQDWRNTVEIDLVAKGYTINQINAVLGENLAKVLAIEEATHG